jgi:signal transduction histidine kinase
MYRLAQEALANARKHSGATQVDLTLSLEGDNLVMSITDNGIGFNVEEAMQKERAGEKIGLQSMRQRIREARGEMTIQSGLDQGTTITFTCPLPDTRQPQSAPPDAPPQERKAPIESKV